MHLLCNREEVRGTVSKLISPIEPSSSISRIPRMAASADIPLPTIKYFYENTENTFPLLDGQASTDWKSSSASALLANHEE
jgi:hypothetical protein